MWIYQTTEDRHFKLSVTVTNLFQPSNAEELLYMLQFGNKNRTQHPTDANAESSRSHAVFQVADSKQSGWTDDIS